MLQEIRRTFTFFFFNYISKETATHQKILRVLRSNMLTENYIKNTEIL